jgi:hypothetical protein
MIWNKCGIDLEMILGLARGLGDTLSDWTPVTGSTWEIYM